MSGLILGALDYILVTYFTFSFGVNDMEENRHSPQKKKGLSDEAVDGIAAIIIIALAVTGAVFWLSSMP